jgi:hypothetical protein
VRIEAVPLVIHFAHGATQVTVASALIPLTSLGLFVGQRPGAVESLLASEQSRSSERRGRSETSQKPAPVDPASGYEPGKVSFYRTHIASAISFDNAVGAISLSLTRTNSGPPIGPRLTTVTFTPGRMPSSAR